MDSFSDFDRQRIEQLNSLIRDDLDALYELDRKQVIETRPLERRQILLQAEQVRESYNHHREEYTDLLRTGIPTEFAPGDQALINTVVQHLNFDQLAVASTALQEADRNPDSPEFTALLAAVVTALPIVQQQLRAKNMPVANHVAQAAQIIQAPTADIKQKLKLSIPLIPLFLFWETEFNLNISPNLKETWARLKGRFYPS